TKLRHVAFWAVQIAKMNGAGWTGGSAGGDDLAFGNPPVFLFRVSPGMADALKTVVAFLHDAAPAHADIGVVARLHRRLRLVGVGLVARVVEPVEAPDLVWAVGFAETRANAPVIDLDVQPLMIVD